MLIVSVGLNQENNIQHGIHLVVEDFGLARRGSRNEMLIKDVEHVTADVFQFLLNLTRRIQQ